MKKGKKIIIISAIILIAIALITFFVIKGIKEESRKYSIEKVEDYNYFVLQENNKYGVIDKNANIVIEPQYEEVIIPNPSKAVFICTTNQKQVKAYNDKKEEQFTNYEEVTAIRLKNVVSDLMYEKSVLKYKKDGKYGLIDYTGKKLTDSIYGNIDALEYKEGELLVEQNGKYGVINIKGNNLVPIEYHTVNVDEYNSPEKGYQEAGYIVGITTNEGYRYGYIDVDGNEILKTEYNEISRIKDIEDSNNKFFIVAKNGQYGVYKNDNKIINNEYQSIDFNKTNNIFILEKSKKYGVATIDGDIILEVKYAQIDINGENLYAKQKDNTVEVFDSKGNKSNIDANTYKYSVADGKYYVVINSKDNKTLYSIQDKQGNEVIKPNYTYIGYLFNDFFVVSNQEGKLGVLDNTEKEKVELNYNSIEKIGSTNIIKATNFAENITAIYSSQMEKIYEMKDAVVEEVDGFIKVYNSTNRIYISQDGKITENTEVLKNNRLFAIKQDNKWGFKDKNGTIKVQCEYDKVTEFNQFGYAGVKKDGKWGAIDENGKIIIQPKYEIKMVSEPEFIGEYYKVIYGFREYYYTNK